MKIFFLLILFSIQNFAQQQKDSLTFSQNNFSDKILFNSFTKQLNTNNYLITFKHNYVYDRIFFGINEQINSTIVSTNTKNIKDEHTLNTIASYEINNNFKLGLHLNNNFYRDDRNIGLNKASITTSNLFLNYSPIEQINFLPFIGYEQNFQLDEKDFGLVYGAESSINDFNLGEFEINSLIKFRNEDISPKKNTLRLFNFELINNFDENFTNLISSSYLQQRRDFYFTADNKTAEEFNINNNIQSRIETNYSLQDRIKLFKTDSPLSFDIIGRIALRTIDRNTKFISQNNIANINYDTKIDELRLEFFSFVELKKTNYSLSFRFGFTERDEKHQPKKYENITNLIFDERKKLEEQKNNTSQLANLSLYGSVIIDKKNSLNFSIFHRKLIYNTPSNLNYDDRDELLSIGNIIYNHKFNQFFYSYINIEASLNKMVYIFSQRSSNNNIKRTIKFSSGGTFTNSFLTSKNSAEVSANYTVFDFEELNPNFKSYSFRQVVVRDSTKIYLSKIFGFNFNGFVKFSEQGNFNWNNFSEVPQRLLTEELYHQTIFYKYLIMDISFGIRYYALKTYKFIMSDTKNLISRYTSFGPTLDIIIKLAEKIDLKFLTWYEFIKDEANRKRQMTNIDLRFFYNF